MLQSLRDNMKGAIAVFVVALMVVPLMLFGVDSLFLNNGSQQEVAKVNGEEVTELELQRALAARKNQLLSQFGDNLPADFIADENLRGPVLDSLIKRKLLAQAARDGGMGVSDQRVFEIIRSAPEFQVDGQFDQNQFRLMVNNVGYTQQGYIAQVAEDLMLNQQVTGLASSGFVTDAELARMAQLSQQQRDFYYLTIPLAPIQAELEISDEEAMAYYEENKGNYLNPEQVSVEYLEVDTQQIAAELDIPEEDIRAQYDQEVAGFENSTERHAAHILVEHKDDGGEQALLAEIQEKLADGADFAELAAEYSDDLGSSQLGGDLGYTAGDVFPEEFEAALASLSVGEVSEPVETDAGFHIIQLLDIQGNEPPTFEEDRERIVGAMRRAESEDIFIETSRTLEDITYNATDLAEAGETLGLEVQTAGPFSRSGGFGIASNRQVVDAAFSDDVLIEDNTSPMLELTPGHVLVLRVIDHQEPRTLTFDEVKNDIVGQLKREKAQQRLVELGEEVKEQVRAGSTIEDIAKEDDYQWQVSLNTQRTAPEVQREILSHVFALPKPAGESVVSGVTTADGNYTVVNLTDVKEGDATALSDAEKANLRNRLANLWGESSYLAYESQLEQEAKISREE